MTALAESIVAILTMQSLELDVWSTSEYYVRGLIMPMEDQVESRPLFREGCQPIHKMESRKDCLVLVLSKKSTQKRTEKCL